jgi:hypothetical protein
VDEPRTATPVAAEPTEHQVPTIISQLRDAAEHGEFGTVTVRPGQLAHFLDAFAGTGTAAPLNANANTTACVVVLSRIPQGDVIASVTQPGRFERAPQRWRPEIGTVFLDERTLLLHLGGLLDQCETFRLQHKLVLLDRTVEVEPARLKELAERRGVAIGLIDEQPDGPHAPVWEPA